MAAVDKSLGEAFVKYHQITETFFDRLVRVSARLCVSSIALFANVGGLVGTQDPMKAECWDRARWTFHQFETTLRDKLMAKSNQVCTYCCIVTW